jgi:hypothetical protein
MQDVIEIASVPRGIGRSEFIIVLRKIHPWTDKKIALIDFEAGKPLELLYEAVAFGEFIEARDVMALSQEVLAEVRTEETRAAGD